MIWSALLGRVGQVIFSPNQFGFFLCSSRLSRFFQNIDPHKPSYHNLFLYIFEYRLYFHFFKNFPLVSPYLPSHSLPLLIPHSLFSSFPPNPQVFLQLFIVIFLGKRWKKLQSSTVYLFGKKTRAHISSCSISYICQLCQ